MNIAPEDHHDGLDKEGCLGPRASLFCRLPRSALGFTIVELLTVIAVMAILLAVAIPGFSFLKKDRVKMLASQLQSDLSYARLEAMRRKNPVSLCKSADGTSCDQSGNSTDWSHSGWLIFVDVDQNNDPSSSKNQILIFHKPEKPASLFAAGFSLTYQLDGKFDTSNGKQSTDFWVCSSEPTHVVRISLPLTGSPVSYSGSTMPPSFPAAATCT